MKVIGYYKRLSFLFGATIILEVFKFSVSSVSLYLADIFFLLFSLFSFSIAIRKRTQLRILDKELKLVLLLFFLLNITTLNIFSPIVDYNMFFSQDGISLSIKYVVKTAFNLILFVVLLFVPSEYQIVFVRNFIKGFICAVFLHALYTLFQMLMWYGNDFDVHTYIFEYMGITEESVGHVLVNFMIFPIIRSSGLHWDPAYFGIWGCIVLFLASFVRKTFFNRLLLGVLIIMWLLTFSRTAYISCVFLFFLIIMLGRKNETFKQLFNTSKIIKFFFYVLVLLFLCFVILLPKEVKGDLYKSIEYRFQLHEHDEGSMRHIMYPVYSVEAVLQDPFHFLFGYGARNSSRGIYESGNLKEFTSDRVFDIESDWCKMLVNYGAISFLIYLMFHIYILYLYVKRMNFSISYIPLFCFVSITSIFIAGISYSYNDSKWVWLIYFISILILLNKRMILNEKE